MSQKTGNLFVVSGPSGSGKGVITKQVSQMTGIPISISSTTRAPREDDIPDVTYHFISKAEFEELIRRGEVMEYNCYSGNYYGTPSKIPLETIRSGKNMILEIDVNGGMNARRIHPETVLIMLLAPSFSEQERRLRGRGKTLSEEQIQSRLQQAREEIKYIEKYDYVLINRDGEMDACAQDLIDIINGDPRAERHRAKNYLDFAKTYFEN